MMIVKLLIAAVLIASEVDANKSKSKTKSQAKSSEKLGTRAMGGMVSQLIKVFAIARIFEKRVEISYFDVRTVVERAFR